ncbi:MAG: amino acid ABC transporter permease [Deltaproteobacteria bacterium]|nr:amino acid ABC transporter permease [Deltaproteobacteria bacterium]
MGRIVTVFRYLAKVPRLVIILAVIGLIVAYLVLTSQVYQKTIRWLWSGVLLTIQITIVAFVITFPIGLIAGLGRVSKNRIFHSLASFYVEMGRGIPVLVQLLYIGYVITPAVARWIGVRNVGEPTRAIIALAISNGAYLAEIFRSGIEAISRGQMEAARSLGMTYFQAMRYVILPQAVRVILPPLGNDLISVLKNSSLASMLAVRELTHLGRANIGLTFDTFTTWNLVALLYLMMTLVLSLGVRILEQRRPLE